MAGGTVYPPEVCDDICDRAHAPGLRVHLDGARIFNAATYSDRAWPSMTRKFDSVMFCFSKGLGAPVGSMLVGSREFIDRARVYRKLYGGGMRQVGVLAAAGLVALEKSPARLHEDHANARYLAEGLARLPGISVDCQGADEHRHLRCERHGPHRRGNLRRPSQAQGARQSDREARHPHGDALRRRPPRHRPRLAEFRALLSFA